MKQLRALRDAVIPIINKVEEVDAIYDSPITEIEMSDDAVVYIVHHDSIEAAPRHSGAEYTLTADLVIERVKAIKINDADAITEAEAAAEDLLSRLLPTGCLASIVSFGEVSLVTEVASGDPRVIRSILTISNDWLITFCEPGEDDGEDNFTTASITTDIDITESQPLVKQILPKP